MEKSIHYTNDRVKREEKIMELGQGKKLASFRVRCPQKSYPKDWEVQTVTDNGIIIVYNAYSGKLVTKLIARKNQIDKLYRAVGKVAPMEVLEKAMEHERLGYNLI